MWGALGLNLVIVAVTAVLAIPIQNQLAEAQSLEAIDRLIAYDRPLRLAPGLIVGALNAVMMFRLTARSDAGRVDPRETRH